MDLGLFAGRQFRVYREFSAATVLRFAPTKPFLLLDQNLYVSQGAARAVIYTGGTEGGTWTDIGTMFPKNVKRNKAPAATVKAGGTYTPGNEREVLLANAGGGQQATNQELSYRLLPAGVYYMVVSVTGSTSGLYSFEFEELED